MPAEPISSDAIGTRPQRTCPVCGTGGGALYEGVRDGSYGSPGEWTFRQCGNPLCGAVWLDPAPSADDLLKAYRGYYTHGPSEAPPAGALKSLYRFAVDGLLRLAGVLAERRRADAMFLDGARPGSLLDVGCGQGIFLARMARCGWTVLGIDFDPDAVTAARARLGLDIRLGGVDSIAGGPRFDVITASHVIEHVPDPTEFLLQCRRLLKPEGKLILRTPNARSFGHGIYRRDWRGLEPPRHLCILTCDAVRLLARKTGFGVVECFTSHAMAESVLIVSHFLRQSGTFDPSQRGLRRLLQWKLLGPLMAVRAKIAWTRNGDCGEEVCAILRRDSALA